MTGKTLDKLVADGITKPLQMRDTGYNPDPKKKPRIAATEFQTAPPRGMVWGSVHDENAWSLGGVAGHAGVFSTADDLAVLAQTFLNGGSYRGARILKESSVTAMITNFNQAFPGNDHGLGFELNQRWYMGGLSGPRTAGHTGYTGTSIVIDFDSRSFAILLTNRVHPSRNWGSNNPARRAVVARPRAGARRRPAARQGRLVLRYDGQRDHDPLDEGRRTGRWGASWRSTCSSTPRTRTCCTWRRPRTGRPGRRCRSPCGTAAR